MNAYTSRAEDAALAKLAVGVVSYALGAPAAAIFDQVRGSADVAFARHLAMYLCNTAFELSQARVAIAFERDRSTVAYACHAIEDRRENEAFELWIAGLEDLLREAATANAANPALAPAQ
jgi:Bacterial dnaA protein helix-turn-helix